MPSLCKPQPILKWPGGKRQLLPVLLKHTPTDFKVFYEPFVGAGALLFSLSPPRAVVGDLNEELVNVYHVVKSQVEALIQDLARHHNDEAYYYTVRAQDPATLDPVQRASRFIYLNKTCYNGLYRENRQGQFNVPFGKYKNPRIVDADNLRAVSAYLNSATVCIYCQDYRQTVALAGPKDFVYFDPPYYPIKSNASFTQYVKHNFTTEDHEQLAETFRLLDRRGCYVLLSNSNTPFVRDLYYGFEIITVEACRFINCQGSRRGKEPIELLVKNF